jgi:hypothetical protein
MKKRSKKRIPQDIKPWQRIRNQSTDAFFLQLKKTVRWTSGYVRNRETTVLNNQNAIDPSLLLLKSFMVDQEAFEKAYFSKRKGR